MKTMYKTAAIKLAQSYVGMPQGRGTSWQIHGPYRYSNLSGPTTSISATSYPQAILKRRNLVAFIAGHLMGLPAADVYFAAYDFGKGSVKDIIDSVTKGGAVWVLRFTILI